MFIYNIVLYHKFVLLMHLCFCFVLSPCAFGTAHNVSIFLIECLVTLHWILPLLTRLGFPPARLWVALTTRDAVLWLRLVAWQRAAAAVIASFGVIAFTMRLCHSGALACIQWRAGVCLLALCCSPSLTRGGL